MAGIFRKIKELFLEILPAFVFFLVMFYMLLITKEIVLKRHGLPAGSSALAVVGALIVAKVVLVANRIPFLNLYPKKPLIYDVALKTIVFSTATMVFVFAEELLRLSKQQGGFAAAWESVSGDFVWPLFLIRQSWIVVLILLYCAGAELTKVIGRDKVSEIFFGKR